MEEITEDHMVDSAKEYAREIIEFQDRSFESAEIDFYNGAKWMQEQLQPSQSVHVETTQLIKVGKRCSSCNNIVDKLMNIGISKNICEDCFDEFEGWRKSVSVKSH